MKKIFIIFGLLCFANLYAFATHYRVLFLGNSYTSVNNLPQMVSTVVSSAGDTITYEANLPGGCTFENHLSQSASLIQQGGWDYVVLQEQSQLPSFPIDQFMQESYPYAQQLCQMIAQYNPQAEVVFYMTWGRKNGDAQNAQYFPVLGTYEGMDSLLRARYLMMAEDNNAIVSPVGALWHFIRHNYPNIELYNADESHPSLIGSYAAACSFYTVLFQHSPLNITEDCGLDAQTAAIVRQAAQRVVYDSLAQWLFLTPQDTTSSDSVGITYQNTIDITLYPNPAFQKISVSFGGEIPDFYNLYIYNDEGLLMDKYLKIEDATYSVDLSTYPAGLYLLKYVSQEGKECVRKFMKSPL